MPSREMKVTDNVYESLDDLFGEGPGDKKETGPRAPFKFLDPYGPDDRDIYFGRQAEIDALYARFYTTRLLVVYGESGAGKTSLIQCGLRSEIPSEDALFITIRSAINPLAALRRELQGLLRLDEAPNEQQALSALFREVTLQKGKSIALILDQFEELFLFQPVAVRDALVGEIASWLASDLNLHVIIGIREEYLARLTELEDRLPDLYENRLWVRRLGREQAGAVIVEPCRTCGVEIEPELTEALLDALTQSGHGIELPILQVVLDTLYQRALGRDQQPVRLTSADYRALGGAHGILGRFVESRVDEYPDPEPIRQVLKAMVTAEGTRQLCRLADIGERAQQFGPPIEPEALETLVRRLIDDRILREDLDDGLFELRHDALARNVAQWMTGLEQELMEVRQTLENRLKEYQATGRLMDAELLDYLAPYETRIKLGDELAELVRASRREANRRRRRRRTIVAATLVSVLAVVSTLAVTSWLKFLDAEQQRALAEEQRVLAEEQRAVAEEQRALADMRTELVQAAERSFAQAANAAEELATAMTEDFIRDFRTPTRETLKLLETAKHAFEPLMPEPKAPGLNLRYAQLWTAVAHELVDRGHIDRALSAAEKGVAVLEALVDQQASLDGLPQALYAAHTARARVETELGSASRAGRALATARKTLGDAPPDTSERLRALLVEAAVATLLLRTDRAASLANEVLDATADTRPRAGGDARFDPLRFDAYLVFGNAQAGGLQEDQALDVLDRALNELSVWLAREPDNLRLLAYSAELGLTRARVFVDAGDSAAADKDLETAETTLAGLVQRDRHNYRWLVLDGERLGLSSRVLSSRNQWPHAQLSINQLATRINQLRPRQPEWIVLQRLITDRHYWSGGLQWRRKAREEAKRHFQALRDWIRELRNADGERPLEDAWLLAYEAAPFWYLGQIDAGKATDYLGECVTIAQDALGRFGEAPRLLYIKGFCETELGLAFQREGDKDEALLHLQRGLKAREALVSRVHRQVDRPELARTHLALGELYREMDQRDAADRHYEQALRLARTLIEQSPEDTYAPWLIPRIGCIHAEAAIELGEYEQALDYFESAASFSMQRLRDFPSHQSVLDLLKDAIPEGIRSLKQQLDADTDLAAAKREQLSAKADDLLATHDPTRLLTEPEQALAAWTMQPFMPGLWYELSGPAYDKAAERIQAALDDEQIAVGGIGRIRSRAIDFYAGARVLEAQVQSDDGDGIVAFVQHGETLYQLNGAPTNIHLMNRELLVRLDTIDRAANYLRFYVGALQADGGRFVILDGIDDLVFVDDAPLEERHKVAGLIQPFSIQAGLGGRWEVQATILYDQAIFETSLTLARHGGLEMNLDVAKQDPRQLPVSNERFVHGIRQLAFSAAEWQERLKALLEEISGSGAPADNVDSQPSRERAMLDLLEVVPSRITASELGNLSYQLLLKGFPKVAEKAASTALERAPEQKWIETNLAHALMYQDRLAEAAAIHEANRGLVVLEKSWRQTILDDFAELRDAGHAHPDMEFIEAMLAEPEEASDEPRVVQVTAREPDHSVDELSAWSLPPLMAGDWADLAGSDYPEAAERIRSALVENGIPASAIGRIRARPIDFYANSRLIEAQVTLHGREGAAAFVENAGKLHHLPGSSTAIRQMNEDLGVRLDTEARAMDYLRLFVDALEDDAGRFAIVDSIDDLRLTDAFPSDRRREVMQAIAPLSIEPSDDGSWESKAALLHSRTLVIAQFTVRPDGDVTISGDVKVAESLPVWNEIFLDGVRLRFRSHPERDVNAKANKETATP